MKLTIQQLSNLLAFLNRINLSGSEVDAFMELKAIIIKEIKKLQEEEAKKVSTK